jgi:hypothetical protein
MKHVQALLSTTSMLAVFTLAPGNALASKDYPTVVQSFWHMKKRLPVPGSKGCMLCHKDEAGNKGTVVQPFGITIHQKYGVGGGNPSALRRALGLVQTQLTNSDKDPVIDYMEIVVDGTSPNDPHDYVEPPPSQPVSEGGQGGEAGAAGASGAGGDGTSVTEEPLPPARTPPPLEDLPPPFTHGCALGTKTGHTAPGLAALFALGASLSARAERRRRRRKS